MIPIRPPKPDCATPRERRVIAVCGDSQVGLSMLRSLARGGLTVYAVCKSAAGQAAHSRYCAGAWMFDRSDDAPPQVEQLLALATELDAGSVMPIDEQLHQALIANRNRFEPAVHVFSPSADCFQKATDKAYLHGLCRQLGIPVAKGTTLDQLSGLSQLSRQGEHAAQPLGHGGRENGTVSRAETSADTIGGLRFPLVLRTSRQNEPGGGRAPWKAAYATSPEQLAQLHGQVREYAENVLVQEYHPGVEDHVHVLMHRGEPFMIGEYYGEHHMPLAGGVTVQRVSCRHEAMQADTVKLLQAIHWDGIATCQFHWDPATGEYIFLEINPRMCGGQPTIIMAGFDSPFLLWQSHFEPDRMQKAPYRLGLRTRILGGDARWLQAMWRRDELPPDQTHLSRLGALARFLWNTGPWTKDDSFAWTDPKPFFVDLVQMARKIGAGGWEIGVGSHISDSRNDPPRRISDV